MKQTMRFGFCMAAALVGATLAGCGAADGGEDSVGGQAEAKPASTSPAKTSVAEQIIAAGAKPDHDLNLITRKFLNNDTEAVEFYEPAPGHILVSATGSPTGASMVRPEMLRGKTASEVWAAVAPKEPMPQALVDAVTRAGAPVSKSVARNPSAASEQPPPGQSVVGAPNPKPDTIVRPEDTGYCASQFWSNFGNSGHGSIVSETYNYGYNYQTWSNITDQTQFAVCPHGNVSGTGGQLTVVFPTGTDVWAVGANYYRLSPIETAGENCGWNVSCWAQGYPGGNQCTPSPFNAKGTYDSACYLSKGTSCGDNYDWYTWADSQGPYCEE
jgi:hypothetical protein